MAMYTKLTLSIDQEEYLSSIASSSLSAGEKIEYTTLGPITKELVGIIKVNKHADYKDILTDALMVAI
jgi:hypothetical protein